MAVKWQQLIELGQMLKNSLTLSVQHLNFLLLLLLLFGLGGYWHCGHSWPIVPASGDNEDDCGEADGMKIGRGNLSS
jgi:hypothetical protein